MSFFKSWTFRTSQPEFSEGDEVELFATGYNDESSRLTARIGDTIIEIPGGSTEMVDCKLSVKITQFDSSRSTGEAQLLEVLEESEF